MRRWSIVVTLAIVLVVGIGSWWTIGARGDVRNDWTAVVRDDLSLGVEISGTLKAVETELIGPPPLRRMWSFKIARLVPEGEEVAEGAVVLAFDSSELEQRLQREIAERDAAAKRLEKAQQEVDVESRNHHLRLAEARARLNKSEMKADRPEDLEAARDLQQFRLDLELARNEVAFLTGRLENAQRSAETRLGALRIQLEEANNDIRSTERDISEMSRRAPRDGTVIYVTGWQGEKKKIGDSCWRGEKVIELPNLERMKAHGQVHEADAGRLSEGQQVRLRLDAHPDVEFTGRVASIWRTVEQESWTSPLKVVRLEVDLDTTDRRRMRPGMRFRGEVETERVGAALLVDVDAVFLGDEGPVALRESWTGYQVVPVKLGRRSKRQVEVLDGLAEGDRVSLVDRRRRRSAT